MANILIVDDDAAVLRVLTLILEGDGHQVHAADSKEAALALLDDDLPYDLFVLDFWIGKDNGLELMELLQQLQPATPVLFLSGGNETVTLEATTALAEMQGAAEFLYKPIRSETLRKAVKRNLQKT
ncbi:response regulator [Rhodobacteraceae bacterium 2376]|uniref:Response regulator n=1 Tax=Rhabdonatronobacter sediminivivens TaxID=2743469 RepID=A0A7Z0HY24_9RHOB|nr:response regulator [Rhabdonatronobacter sediminivivens]NYS24390.1 response regulator [Rhabdonatronobacter sediminivivens]